MKHQNGSFSSSFAFILASVGSAVGLGNIWLFPYRLGQYGGAAFLIPYLFFIVLFGAVGLSAEFAIGRKARTGRKMERQAEWERPWDGFHFWAPWESPSAILLSLDGSFALWAALPLAL